MVLDKYIEKEINGKTYQFCLPIKYLFKAERETTRKSLILTMSELPLNVEDIFVLFKYAFLGGGNKENDVEALFYDAIDDLGLPAIQMLIIDVLQKSGVFGKPKKV